MLGEDYHDTFVAFQDAMFQVLDELITPLTTHISQLLAQPASGTDDALTHGESKKGYLNLLSNIMASKLQGVFLSERAYQYLRRLFRNL